MQNGNKTTSMWSTYVFENRDGTDGFGFDVKLKNQGSHWRRSELQHVI